MKYKYNLALLPQNKTHEMIQMAQSLSQLSDQYLLGKNSLPHVTLYQFKYEEDEIPHLWQSVCRAWDDKPVQLEFAKISYISFDQRIYWASLLPDKIKLLHEMHELIAKLLKMPVKENFDPHLSLMNTLRSDCEKEIDACLMSRLPIRDGFTLGLGRSDGIGQFVGGIYNL